MEEITKDAAYIILTAIISGLSVIIVTCLGWFFVQLWKRQNHLYKKQEHTDERINIIFGEHRRNHKK